MRKHHVSIGIVAAAVLGLSGFSSPTIMWQPESIDTEVFQGGIRTIDVTLTSARDIENVSFRATPSIEEFVKISPLSIDHIEAGDPQTLQVTINVPSGTLPRTFGGVVQVISGAEKGILEKFIDKTFRGKPNKETIFARPLPISFEVTSPQPAVDALEDLLLQEFGTIAPSIDQVGIVTLSGNEELFKVFSEGTDAEAMLFSVGSLIPKGIWLTNPEAENGLSDLLDELENRGVIVDELRTALMNHDLHAEGTLGSQFLSLAPGLEAVTFFPRPDFPSLALLGITPYDEDGNGSVDTYVVILDNDTHALHTEEDIGKLIAKDHFENGGLRESASTVMHELFHALIFRTGCLAGSIEDEEEIAAKFEVIIKAKIIGLRDLLAEQIAINLGGGDCLDRLGLLSSLPDLPPKTISDQAEAANPDIEVGGGDTIHVVWRALSSGAFRVFHQRSEDLGETFTASEQISVGEGDTPSVAATGSNAYITYIAPAISGSHAVLHRSTDGGATFSAPVILSTGTASNGPDVAADGNIVAVVWAEAGSTLVSVSSDSGVSFGPPVELSNAGSLGFPRVAVSGNVIGVVRSELAGSHLDVFYAESTDAGQSFLPSLNVSNSPAVNSGQPDVALDGSGTPYIVWDEFQTNFHPIHFSKKENGSFSIPMTITNGFFSPRIRLSENNGTGVNIVWVGASPILGADIYLSQSMDGGETFEPPENVSSTGQTLEPSFDIDSSGSFHTVWSFPGTPPSVQYLRLTP